ncbi:GNAT family N-acetyltransferase [Lentibacter sp. XHP0401]|uniref:GNAT family N-acetyltransferase n=1 Tax=Lentibacter sp. XHP0401 TaxID=2984334 RepID=UPI0021E939FD|nr:GNAT family N-acetyltransferase [Lentibacter sp. XHP0401]MCV2892442.1 GNAT family N-acetyltransferase [Lentibacter sp. XHP0401]
MLNSITPNPDFRIRHATGEDAALVVDYMKKLGTYQKMADKITATAPDIKRLLDESLGEAIFGIYKGQVIGFLYFCQKSSAFTGRSGLYVDGFLVDTDVRHLGFGKLMWAYLSKLALERGCLFLEWGCLDWNTPAIAFYRGLGAYSVDDMTIFRFTPDALKANALTADTASLREIP